MQHLNPALIVLRGVRIKHSGLEFTLVQFISHILYVELEYKQLLVQLVTKNNRPILWIDNLVIKKSITLQQGYGKAI